MIFFEKWCGHNLPTPIQLVHCTGVTEDGLLSYSYAKKAKYGLKLPERNEEILLPNAESVGAVLLESVESFF